MQGCQLSGQEEKQLSVSYANPSLPRQLSGPGYVFEISSTVRNRHNKSLSAIKIFFIATKQEISFHYVTLEKTIYVCIKSGKIYISRFLSQQRKQFKLMLTTN